MKDPMDRRARIRASILSRIDNRALREILRARLDALIAACEVSATLRETLTRDRASRGAKRPRS